MLRALGARFLDSAGDEIEEGGLALKALRQIDLNRLDERLHKVRIEVACDVNNPLTGLHGASHVFGPQKGATPDQVLALDEALNTYADIVAALLQKDVRDFPGAGAAGNRVRRQSISTCGIPAWCSTDRGFVWTESGCSGADLVITGEGRLDEQTLYGKTLPGWLSSLLLRECLSWQSLARWESDISGCATLESLQPSPSPLGP